MLEAEQSMVYMQHYYMNNEIALFFFFANRTLASKETTNSTKHLKKNENYNDIFEKPFIFNLQTVSTARRRCRSSLSRPDVDESR
jgi:hypothetical protein